MVAVMAVTLHAADVMTAVHGIDQDTAERLLKAACVVVERFANAPGPVHDEAALRLIGYWHDMGTGAIRSETATTELGPKTDTRTVEYAADHGGTFRRCGAEALLSPYRVRRAGVI